MRIADLIEDDKGKLAVLRWPDSDEFEVGRITRWDDHFVYVSSHEFKEQERAWNPKYVRLLQGQP